MERVIVQDVVQVLLKLPPAQVATVYEFARFLQNHHLTAVDVPSEQPKKDSTAMQVNGPYVEETKFVKLSDLAGVGQELWQAIDVEQYSQEERDAWGR